MQEFKVGALYKIDERYLRGYGITHYPEGGVMRCDAIGPGGRMLTKDTRVRYLDTPNSRANDGMWIVAGPKGLLGGYIKEVELRIYPCNYHVEVNYDDEEA